MATCTSTHQCIHDIVETHAYKKLWYSQKKFCQEKIFANNIIGEFFIPKLRANVTRVQAMATFTTLVTFTALLKLDSDK